MTPKDATHYQFRVNSKIIRHNNLTIKTTTGTGAGAEDGRHETTTTTLYLTRSSVRSLASSSSLYLIPFSNTHGGWSPLPRTRRRMCRNRGGFTQNFHSEFSARKVPKITTIRSTATDGLSSKESIFTAPTQIDRQRHCRDFVSATNFFFLLFFCPSSALGFDRAYLLGRNARGRPRKRQESLPGSHSLPLPALWPRKRGTHSKDLYDDETRARPVQSQIPSTTETARLANPSETDRPTNRLSSATHVELPPAAGLGTACLTNTRAGE